jgi:hypothetical protein
MAVKGRKYKPSEVAVSFRKEESMIDRDRWQCKKGRKYEPSVRAVSLKKEQSMNNKDRWE